MTSDGFLGHPTNHGYGDAWEQYPVQPGQEWRIGPHRVISLDMQTVAGPAWWQRQQYQIFYSDPPWDQGNAQAFRTKAGSGERAAYQQLMDRLAMVASRAESVFVELGVKKDVPWNVAAANFGVVFERAYNVVYGKPPRPNLLWQGGTFAPSVPVEGKTSDAVVEAALLPWANTGVVVADPCCGLGMTARACHRLGLAFIGSELHPRRLAQTISWLARATGETPAPV